MREEFERFVHERLSAHSDALRSQLRILVGHSFPPEVAGLEFDVFADGFTSGFPVRAFFLDSNRTEHFIAGAHGPEYPSPIDPTVLEIPAVFSAAEEAQFAERDPSLDTFTVAGETLVTWFAAEWRRAGGAKLPIAATIGLHDDVSRLDLLSGERIPT